LVAEVLNLSKSAVERLVKSMKCGRVVGVVGRARVRTPEEEARLVSALDEADKNQDGLSYKRFQEVVCFSPRISANTFSSIFLTQLILIHIYKAKDIYLSNPERNIAGGPPEFTRPYISKFLKRNNFITRTSRPIDQVCHSKH
jgi:hypothetical protein